MNAPVSTETKEEVIRSVLDRWRERNSLAKFFRYNAAAKHGVPIEALDVEPAPVNITIHEERKDVAAPLQPVIQPQPTQPPVTQPTPTPQSGMSDFMKMALATMAVVGGLGGAGAVGYMLSKPKEPAPVVQPEGPEWRESIYQYLEDRGEHLP